MKKDYKKIAAQIMEKVGGEENVKSLTHCMTRLRFILKDNSIAKTEELKALENVATVVEAAGQYQVVIGNEVVNVFREITAGYKVNATDALDIDEGDVVKPTGIKGVWTSFLDYITGTMVQTLPVLIGSGLISVVLVIAVNMFGMSTESPTYKVFNFVYNAGFYFLPIYVGFAAAKKLNSNPFLTAFMGAVLVHPTLGTMVSEGTTEMFGIHFMGISYGSSVIPMLLIAFVMSYIEKYSYKLLPSALQSTFAPMITILITTPIALFILGPLGYIIGSGVVNMILWVYETAPFLAVPVVAVCWPLLVMVGAHALLVPTMTELLATVGFDAIIKPGGYISNFVQLGVVLAIMYKSKKLRAVAAPAATSLVFGIIEPGLYGLILPLKTTMFAMMGGCAIGGLAAAILGVRNYTYAANSILSIVIFGDTMIKAIIAVAISIAAGFGLTLLIGFKEE